MLQSEIYFLSSVSYKSTICPGHYGQQCMEFPTYEDTSEYGSILDGKMDT